MVLSRRNVLAMGLFGTASVVLPAHAQSRSAASGPLGHLGLDAGQFGLRSGAAEDQSRQLLAALKQAAARGAPLLLPPGRYRIGGVNLPENARIAGVPGETHLVTADGQPVLIAHNLARAELSGLSFDGLDIPSAQRIGLLTAQNVGELEVSGCAFAKAGSVGLTLDRCGGRITANRFGNMRDAALFAIDSKGLSVEQNRVEDCGNNGIQIWRNQPGDDGSIVRGNHVLRIRADAGGSGQNGNGISVFRAGGVIIEGNQLRDCAMTFIRNNSGSGVQMLGNQGRRCGEVGLYSEFAFEGAIIANNLVEDCAAGATMTNLDHGGRIAICANNIIRRVKRADMPYTKDPVGGFGIHVEAEAAVTGNVIEDASDAGISLGWSWGMRNLAATGNVIRKTGIGISVSLVPKERNALIANNVIAEARDGAVIGTEYGKPVTGDLTKGFDSKAAGVVVANNAVR
ncbi:TIGR03808 family TAT-translocated repetitive protein [Bosea sp. ANAM02]|uniref:TIGR03808 family TAT-translocated repetitive protein n=1 Tax=Bosea sp. ANAM02 TaxID=2020412 RepID=UPI00140EF788|nr:TIGR03808 family TAT-translocated repetitive protein [Bosea sp. ANAM02]BCB20611.1 Tat protein [Bosea sp. ANAM02]